MASNLPPTSVGLCPSLDVLSDYKLSRLSGDLADSVQSHIATCAICKDRLDTPEIAEGAKKLAPTEGPDGRGFSVATASFENTPVEPVRTATPVQMYGPYELVETLGQGGMGEVYRACNEKNPELWVALKLIRPLGKSRQANATTRQRFLEEGAKLSRLKHPNIVRLFHFDDQDGELYFTMELLPTNLRERIRAVAKGQAEPFQWRQVAKLGEQLARGCAHAHASDIIHRDLKPHNILLEADGTPKIADFGLALIRDDDDLIAGSGTAPYMAPEQIRCQEIDERTDVYGLGTVLYECLTGKPPFSTEGTTRDIKQRVLDEPAPSPRTERPDIPAALDTIVRKCLAKSKEDRYPNATSLAEALAKIQRPPRWPWIAAASAICVAGIVLGAIAFSNSEYAKKREAMRRIRNGEYLIGEKGGPVWHKSYLGATVPKIDEEKDEFRVQGDGISYLELTPEPLLGDFEISADICHALNPPESIVGLYLFRRSTISQESKRPWESALWLYFADSGNGFEHLRDNPEEIPPRVHFGVLYANANDATPLSFKQEGTALMRYKFPGGDKMAPTRFHHLWIRVSDGQVVAKIDEQRGKPVPLTWVQKNIESATNSKLFFRPALGGGAGIFVSDGILKVKNFKIRLLQ